MRVLLQRVSRAEVRVRGSDHGETLIGRINRGFVLLVGFTTNDAEAELVWMVDKVCGLRVFGDAEGRMNLALADIGGALLVVSQFTLYGDASKGRRPSFVDAAPPEKAILLYDTFVALLRQRALGLGVKVETGQFGSDMSVELINDGPVTFWLER
ncbi:MAG: D-aminoacyl-tRNA deacylase [Gemmatimonadaceae bacterium]